MFGGSSRQVQDVSLNAPEFFVARYDVKDVDIIVQAILSKHLMQIVIC